MMNDVRKQLQAEIQKAEADLNMKKLLLDQLSREPKKDFFETPVGRSFHKFLAMTSEPFAKVHSNAIMALKEPLRYKTEKALLYAKKIYVLCTRIKDNTDPRAKKFALKAAETQMMLEQLPNVPDGLTSTAVSYVQLLREEVQRLRPPRTAAQEKEAENFAQTFQSAVEDLARNLTPNGGNPQEA